jgi:hypothetical protein
LFFDMSMESTKLAALEICVGFQVLSELWPMVVQAPEQEAIQAILFGIVWQELSSAWLPIIDACASRRSELLGGLSRVDSQSAAHHERKRTSDDARYLARWTE